MKRLLLLVVMVAISTPAYGQDIIQSDVQGHNWDVFILRDAENSAATDIIFVDLLTGATSRVNTSGEGHALTSAGVIYVAAEDRQVKLAKADGIIRDHPYITASPDDYRIDWVLSADRQRIAWAIARKTADDQLVTSVHVADSAGTDIRAVLQYGPPTRCTVAANRFCIRRAGSADGGARRRHRSADALCAEYGALRAQLCR